MSIYNHEQTCQEFPKSAGRRAGPDGAGGGSAPGRSHPTSARWGLSLPRRTSNERLELEGKHASTYYTDQA